MRKYTRLLLLALFLVMMPAVNAAAAVVYESPQEVNDFEEVRITLNGANLRVQNGSGMSVEIYNITGKWQIIALIPTIRQYVLN